MYGSSGNATTLPSGVPSGLSASPTSAARPIPVASGGMHAQPDPQRRNAARTGGDHVPPRQFRRSHRAFPARRAPRPGEPTGAQQPWRGRRRAGTIRRRGGVRERRAPEADFAEARANLQAVQARAARIGHAAMAIRQASRRAAWGGWIAYPCRSRSPRRFCSSRALWSSRERAARGRSSVPGWRCSRSGS